jgi:4-cresol dehydrogenase (hydroxylating)
MPGLDDFRAIVGASHVVTDATELDGAGTATFATSARPLAIVRPSGTEEVQELVRAAAHHGLSLYPVSAGKNWGLGSRVPTADGSVLLELSRMSRIVHFDEELAAVTVEPGVTFAQLYRFLGERKSRLFANTTGASPHASVLGNAIERGDGTGPNGDRFNHVAGLEVVLGSGEVLRTGFARYDQSPLGPLHRWGVGPALDGIFTQSNLGIVTRMTLWLTPLPRALAAVRFSFRDPARLPGCMDALRNLRLEGTLRSVAGIWNDYRVLSVEGQYPWRAAGEKTPLDRSVLSRIAEAWGGATWFGLTAVYSATDAQCSASVARVRELLAPHVDELQVEQKSGEPTSGAELFTDAEPAFQFLQGIPHEGSIQSVYWRKRQPPPAAPDPDRDRCGVLWLCPTVPFRGSDVSRAVACAERVLPAHGFEPLIAMVAQTERTVYLFPLIVYDRDVAGEDARARACHDALLTELSAMGCLPFRLGIQSMSALPPSNDDFAAVLRRVRQVLDPHGTIAPGRYDQF